MLPPTTVILLLCLSLTAAARLRSAAVSASAPRQCYSCEGINCQRTTLQNATVQCDDLLDICVTVYDAFRVSERGCLLELSLAGKAKCEARDLQCQKCTGELCNNQGRVDFKCIQCNGQANSQCNAAGDNIAPIQCGAPTSSNAYCYVKALGSHLERGCALSVKEQMSCLKDGDCSLCLPEIGHADVACNNYILDAKSGAGKAQHIVGLLLGLVSLLTCQGLH